MPTESCFQRFVQFVAIHVALPVCLLLMVLVMPFVRLYECWVFDWFPERHISNRADHKAKVDRVQAQVRKWHEGGRKKLLCSSRPKWASFSTRTASKRGLNSIDIGDLDRVVEVDEARKQVTVEPGVMIGQLVSLLIRRGWTIHVVPEFECLSIGGLVCGAGVESSSGHHGLFGDIPLECEFVVSNGDVVICSKDQNSDLFLSIPWSHGTLGFLTAVTLPLIKAAKYVEVEYHATDSPVECQRLFEAHTHEFVEGIIYGPDKFVVTMGNFSERPDPPRGPVNHVTRWYKPYWYKHVESFLSNRRRGRRQGDGVYVDYVPLKQYYHRHTPGYFWTLPIGLPYSNNPIYRFFLGWIVPVNTKMAKRIILGLGLEQVALDMLTWNYVIQDIGVPTRHFQEAFHFLHETVQVYPLWLCPTRAYNKPGMTRLRTGHETELYVDFGVYGKVPRSKHASFEFEKTTRLLENFVIDHQGFQGLYADSLMSREDFRRMFDMTLYDQVRAKYQCLDAFPDVYDKVGKYARGITKEEADQPAEV